MHSANYAAARWQATQIALANCARLPLPKATRALFGGLGYSSEKSADFGNDAETFLSSIEQFKPGLGKISRDQVKSTGDFELITWLVIQNL